MKRDHLTRDYYLPRFPLSTSKNLNLKQITAVQTQTHPKFMSVLCRRIALHCIWKYFVKTAVVMLCPLQKMKYEMCLETKKKKLKKMNNKYLKSFGGQKVDRNCWKKSKKSSKSFGGQKVGSAFQPSWCLHPVTNSGSNGSHFKEN